MGEGAAQVMTVGLKTVREICMRCPLVMDEELLSDLVLYKKERDKHVKNAAKALAAVFRELKPSMLGKKERGRGADLSLQLKAYGANEMRDRCASKSHSWLAQLRRPSASLVSLHCVIASHRRWRAARGAMCALASGAV